MKTPRAASLVGSRELKTRLGSYLRKVQAGATLVVTDRGRPVAELRPIASGTGKLEDRLAELAALGVVSWNGIVGKLPAPPPALRIGGKSLASALIPGREDRF
jgi:prevent-host-death family protein